MTTKFKAVYQDIRQFMLDVRRQFNLTTGHTHTGVADDGPQLATGALNLAWTSWANVITVTQGVAVTATVVYARYMALGKLAIVEASLNITSAGTGGQVIVIGGVPAAIEPDDIGDIVTVGTAHILDTGTGNYVGALNAKTASTFQVMTDDGSDWAGASPNFALANTDKISFTAKYKIA